MPRQIDNEHAPGTGYVANAQNSPAGLYAVAAYHEPKSEPGFVTSKLRKWLKHLLDRTRRQPSAVVLDLFLTYSQLIYERRLADLRRSAPE